MTRSVGVSFPPGSMAKWRGTAPRVGSCPAASTVTAEYDVPRSGSRFHRRGRVFGQGSRAGVIAVGDNAVKSKIGNKHKAVRRIKDARTGVLYEIGGRTKASIIAHRLDTHAPAREVCIHDMLPRIVGNDVTRVGASRRPAVQKGQFARSKTDTLGAGADVYTIFRTHAGTPFHWFVQCVGQSGARSFEQWERPSFPKACSARRRLPAAGSTGNRKGGLPSSSTRWEPAHQRILRRPNKKKWSARFGPTIHISNVYRTYTKYPNRSRSRRGGSPAPVVSRRFESRTDKSACRWEHRYPYPR